MVVGHREADCHLTVVLLAELTAVLPCHADRKRALLREAGIVDDPRADGTVTLDRGHHLLTHRGEHGLIRPLGLRLAPHLSTRDAEQLQEIATELDARALRQEAAERDDKHDEGGL